MWQSKSSLRFSPWLCSLTLLIVLLTLTAMGQQASIVPPLIPFSNVATDEGGNTLSGVVSITFSLYNGQQGGEPLWTETQNNVQLDPTGHYSVQLGITKPNGVPTTLFTTGEARWLGVQIAQQPEQPRVLLLSVPYALKAGDAATVGGLPPSAFVLAAPLSGSAASESTTFTGLSTSAADAPPAGSVTGSGTVDFIPLWTTTSNIGNSVLFQSATAPFKIGINTTTPATTLDVKGAGTIRGLLSLPAAGVATAAKGTNSQPLDLVGSAFNSGTSAAVNQTFQWQTEPAGNDTSTPSGTLNLLFGEGTAKPSETGLRIASDGQIVFATGQIFPGTGDGTITGVTTAAGSGLTGGGTSGTLNLGLKTCSANQVLQYVSGAWTCSNAGTGTITGVTAGTDLTGGGTSGTVTLNLNTANVPLLAAANTFTANQTVNGTVTATSIGNSIVGNTSGINGTGTGVIGNSTVTTGSSLGVLGQSSSTGGSGVEGYASATSGNTIGVWGLTASPTGYGVYGEAIATSGNPIGVYGTPGIHVAGIGVSGTAPVGGIGVYGENQSITVGGDGIEGIAHTSNGNGVHGINSASFAVGVFGENSATNGYGVYGAEYGSTTETYGLFGYSASSVGVGTYGQAVSASTEGTGFGGTGPFGVWGDTGSSSAGGAVLATADDNFGLVAVNNSALPTGYFVNGSSVCCDDVLKTVGGAGGICYIDVSGNLTCNGSITPVVPVGGSRQVALNTISSPEHWFEDAGSGQLSNGEAVVTIEAVFGETVNTGMEYHVFLTPNGDCKGLYVTQKSPVSFVVRELGGGTSSIGFDYRIMAKRKGFEQLRLVDKTEQMNVPRPKRVTGPRPAMPTAQDMRRAQEAHLHTPHLAQPVLKTK